MAEIIKDYSEDYPHLVKYRRLKRELEEYRQQYLELILNEERKEFIERTLDLFPKLIRIAMKRLALWCLNTDVTPVPLKCETLACPFKSSPEKVLEGIIGCRKFQITEAGTTYDTLEKLALPSSLEVGEGL